MDILINLGGKHSKWLRRSRSLASAIKPLLESLVRINQIYLNTHSVPKIYESGVRYKNEPEEFACEEFASIPAILVRGWGDCDDLAPWRVAELRQAGEKAKIRVQWKRMSNGLKMFHIVVRRGDGRVEDPSDLLGMKE